MIEPKFEEEMRRRRLHDGDLLSDSSSSASDLPYPSRTLMSSPLKAPLFSDAIGSSSGSTGHRKRTYLASFDNTFSSPSKRFRQSPTAHRSFPSHDQFIQSSPIKPRRQQHFTTSAGPDLSFYSGSRQISDVFTTTTPANYAANSDDEDDLPTHSFQASHVRVSPPRTPPMRSRGLVKRNRDRPAAAEATSNDEGADLLLYLATSPSPANPPRNHHINSHNNHYSNSHYNSNSSTMGSRMDPPSTPPPKNKMALPSSMMTTPGGGNPYPATPGLGFDFAEFLHMTPSPAQKPWKTPVNVSGAKTPRSVTRRRLAFDDVPS